MLETLRPADAAALVATLVLRRLGGQGSGNFGHVGRPGEVGGSGEGKGTLEHVTTDESGLQVHKWTRGGEQVYIKSEKGVTEGARAKVVAALDKTPEGFLQGTDLHGGLYIYKNRENSGVSGTGLAHHNRLTGEIAVVANVQRNDLGHTVAHELAHAYIYKNPEVRPSFESYNRDKASYLAKPGAYKEFRYYTTHRDEATAESIAHHVGPGAGSASTRGKFEKAFPETTSHVGAYLASKHGVRMLQAKQRPPENAVHAAADRHVKAVKLAVKAAFAMGKTALGHPGFPNADAAANTVKLVLLHTLHRTFLSTMKAGGDAGLSLIASMKDAEERALAGPTLRMRFDVNDPKAIAWAHEHGAEMASQISETTREKIREAVASALEGDGVEKAWQSILDAVGDEDRADLIARTETMIAANEGQREGWEQAIGAGLLPPESRKVWIATGDADVCPECEALDGTEVALDEEYPDDGGDGPPLHPRCRCTEGIVG